MDDADALSWTSWSGSAWERVLLASGVGNEADGTVPLNDITSDVKRALERLKTSMVRAGMVGGALKGGLNLFALLARARKRGVRRAAAADAVRDTVSFAAFLVAFSGVYVSVDEGLSLRYGKQRSKSWRAAVAGAFAGPTLLLADGVGRGPAADPRRHHGLATYVWLRSVVLLVRCAIKRRDRLTETQRRLLAPFASDHADVGLMMASATVILSCFILKPEALRGAYASFLDKHGGKSVAHYRAAQRVVSAADGEETSAALAAAADRLYPNDLPARDALLAAAAKDPAAQRAARVLLGFTASPGAIGVWSRRAILGLVASPFRRRQPANLRRPRAGGAPRASPRTGRTQTRDARGGGVRAIERVSLGVLRARVVGAGARAARRGCGQVRGPSRAASPPRESPRSSKNPPRQELGVYCASRAVEAAALCAVSWGWVPRRAREWRVDVALFSLAAASIMHCYNAERDVFRSKYLNVLDFVFGNQGHGRQSVRHVGSAYQLMSMPSRMASPPRREDDARRDYTRSVRRTRKTTRRARDVERAKGRCASEEATRRAKGRCARGATVLNTRRRDGSACARS